MIRQTRALQKLARLKKRIWVVQGGQGAGKTFSILILIANYAKGNADKEIFICGAELSKMRITVIKDFIKILKEIGIYDPNAFTGGTFYRFPNGSFIKFIGLDKEDIGKGLRSDLVFVNEANRIDFETYRELTARAKRVIIDFNPNGIFWAHEEVMTREDAEFIILTFEDNEFLDQAEVAEIMLMKSRAFIDPTLKDYDRESNVKSKYWRNKWNVYGRGMVGSNPNRIFYWTAMPDEDYKKLPYKRYFGVDWGVVDPWGIVEAKYHDGNLYLHELNYASENDIMSKMTPKDIEELRKVEEGIVKMMFQKLDIPKTAVIVCDDNRPMKVVALRAAGYDYAITAAKGPGSIEEGIELISKLNVFYTASSKNLAMEQEKYSRVIDRFGVVLSEPEDANNHLAGDPTRYICQFLRAQGIIKVI